MKAANICLASIAVLASLCGCAPFTPVTQLTVEQIRDKCKITHDDFRKTTAIDGLEITFGPLGQNSFGLAAIKSDNDKRILYRFWLRTDRGQWAFWDQAFDEHGSELPRVAYVSDVVNAYSLLENTAFRVQRQWLDSYSQTGVTIRVDGKRAQQIFTLPPNYIQGFLLQCGDTFKPANM